MCELVIQLGGDLVFIAEAAADQQFPLRHVSISLEHMGY